MRIRVGKLVKSRGGGDRKKARGGMDEADKW